MKKQLLYAVVGSVLTLLLLFVIVSTRGYSWFEGIASVLIESKPVAKVDSSRTILQSIQPLGQLVTISAEFAKADIRVSVRQGALNACGVSANHVAVGSIEAGVDLSQVTTEDVSFDESTQTYTIRLPAPELTSCRINFIRQYERQRPSVARIGTKSVSLQM